MKLAPIAMLAALIATAAAAMTDEELAAMDGRVAASLTIIEQAATNRRDDVRDIAAGACERLWAKDADAAILNPICYDLFVSRGLPD